jgi:hypothetical protein
MSDKIYSEQEMKLAILETHQSHAFKTMDDIKSQHRWMMGLMAGLYVLIASIYFVR